MIVQLIGTKYVQILEAVWADPSTHMQYHPFYGIAAQNCTHACMDMNPMSLVRGMCLAENN